MSAEATFWAKRQPCTSPTEKCILLVIADYAGPDGTCYPGQATVASQACCSIKSVERALAAFEQRGWLSRTLRRRPDGYRTSDLIHFKLADNAELERSATSPDRMSDEFSRTSPDTSSHEIGSHATPGTISPDTMSELNLLVEPLEDAVAATRARMSSTGVLSDWPSGDDMALVDLLAKAAGTVRLDPKRSHGLIKTSQHLRKWRQAGASWTETVVPVVVAFSRLAGPPIRSWAFFDRFIADSIACWHDVLEIPQ